MSESRDTWEDDDGRGHWQCGACGIGGGPITSDDPLGDAFEALCEHILDHECEW